MSRLARLARDSEDTASDYRVEACEFTASSFTSAFVRMINRRVSAKPEPARDVPLIIERWSSVPTGPPRPLA